MKILEKLIISLYGSVGIMNIIMGTFYNKNFYQLITGLLFIVLLIDKLIIRDLQEIIKINERNL